MQTDTIYLEGLDTCILGFSSNNRAIYDVDKIVQLLMDRDGMSKEDAIEFFEYNILTIHLSGLSPILVEVQNGIPITDRIDTP